MARCRETWEMDRGAGVDLFGFGRGGCVDLELRLLAALAVAVEDVLEFSSFTAATESKGIWAGV